MIITTRTNDAVCRKAFGSKSIAISSLDAMIQKFAIDPKLNNPPHEAYIVSNIDLRNKKLKDKFLHAATTKHPDVKIIYCVKNGAADLSEGNGIDAVVVKPQPTALADIVYELIEGAVAEKGQIISAADDVMRYDKFVPEELKEEDSVGSEEAEDLFDYNAYTEKELSGGGEDRLPIETPAEEVVEDSEKSKQSEFIERIKGCNKVTDVAVLTRELKATSIIKEIVKENAKYTNYESHLKILDDQIFRVYADKSIPNGREKLNKIQMLLRESLIYRDGNIDILSKYITSIIDTIVVKTRELLDERLKEVESALIRVSTAQTDGGEYARLSGIADKRTSIMLELLAIDAELRDIFSNTDRASIDIASDMVEKAKALTGKPLIDDYLKVYDGGSIISEESKDRIRDVLETCDRTSEEFKRAARDVNVMLRKMDELLGQDRDAIMQLSNLVKLYRANNVEDAVIANTLLKKTLRVYIAKEGSGRTIIPLLISKAKSRENANVLYMDLTGTSKAADYGQVVLDLDDWLQNRQEEEFLAVSGKLSDAPESSQRLLTALMKVVDYYKVINVVIDPSQEEVLHVLAPDTLVRNYLMEITTSDAEFYKDYLKETVYENVGRRIILNKCSIDAQVFLEKLDVFGDISIQLVKIPYMSVINECSLRKADPYSADSVKEFLREVIKLC